MKTLIKEKKLKELEVTNTTSVKKDLERSEICEKDPLYNNAFENKINKKYDTKVRNTKS